MTVSIQVTFDIIVSNVIWIDAGVRRESPGSDGINPNDVRQFSRFIHRITDDTTVRRLVRHFLESFPPLVHDQPPLICSKNFPPETA